MTSIFETKLLKVGTRQVLRLPMDQSEKLPSRGLVMVQGTINDVPFKQPLEPDGKRSHWLEVSPSLSEAAGISVGDTVSLNIESIKDWIEPDIAEDILQGLADGGVMDQWNAINAKSRWEWLRWIRSTLNPETRSKRIKVAASKLENGAKTPCCFDTARCTVPDVSKSGVLID